MEIRDPRHPLYGQRFRVASRPLTPGRKSSYIQVFFEHGLEIRIPREAAEGSNATKPKATKLTKSAMEELVQAAQALEYVHPSKPALVEPIRKLEGAGHYRPCNHNKGGH